MTGSILKPQISATARTRVAEDFAWLPDDAIETAAGWLTLIEQIDAQYDPMRAAHSTNFETATLAAKRLRPLTPREFDGRRREWMAAREAFVRGFADFLALYPRPMFIPVGGKGITL